MVFLHSASEPGTDFRATLDADRVLTAPSGLDHSPLNFYVVVFRHAVIYTRSPEPQPFGVNHGMNWETTYTLLQDTYSKLQKDYETFVQELRSEITQEVRKEERAALLKEMNTAAPTQDDREKLKRYAELVRAQAETHILEARKALAKEQRAVALHRWIRAGVLIMTGLPAFPIWAATYTEMGLLQWLCQWVVPIITVFVVAVFHTPNTYRECVLSNALIDFHHAKNMADSYIHTVIDKATTQATLSTMVSSLETLLTQAVKRLER